MSSKKLKNLRFWTHNRVKVSFLEYLFHFENVFHYKFLMKKTNLSMLLVDDDQYFRLAVRNIISEFGLITEASSEEEAKELIAQNHYDMALIDMQMDSNEDGLNVLKNSVRAGIHSIILSSYNDDEVTEMAYEAGCHHFLTKIHYAKNIEPYIVNFIKKFQ